MWFLGSIKAKLKFTYLCFFFVLQISESFVSYDCDRFQKKLLFYMLMNLKLKSICLKIIVAYKL